MWICSNNFIFITYILISKGITTPSVKRSIRLDPIGSIVYMVPLYLTLGNGSGVDLECQVKRHHRLALVMLLLLLTLDAQCGYSLKQCV